MHLRQRMMKYRCILTFYGRTFAWKAIRVLVGAIAITVIVSCACAAELLLSFAPMLVELTVVPGAVETFEIVILNKSKVDSADFQIYLADIVQGLDGEYDLQEVGASQYSCAKWISLSADEAIVGPNSTLAITGTLKVPRGVSGGRYAAIVLELLPQESKADPVFATTTFVQRFVTVIEVFLPAPQVRNALSVTGFNVMYATEDPVYESVYGKNAVILSAELKNDGNTHAFVSGRMILRDQSGKRLLEIPLGAGRGIVLPETTVNLSSVLSDGLASGNYTADISVRYGGMRPATAKVPFSIGESGTEVAKMDASAVIAPFSVDPDQLNLSGLAGSTVARALVVENRSDQTIRIEGRTTTLAFDDEGELIEEESVLEDETLSTHSCVDWIELRPNAVEIRPRARQVVRMMISIPKGESGGKYANVVFTATPVASGESSTPDGSTWSGESGTVVFLRVGKELEPIAELTPITIDDGGPSVGTVFGTVFSNTGTIHVKPRASLTLKRRVMPESVPGIEYIGPGSLVDVDSLDLGEELSPVLPGCTRSFDVALAGQLESGDYVVEFLVEYGGKSPLYVMREFTVE